MRSQNGGPETKNFKDPQTQTPVALETVIARHGQVRALSLVETAAHALPELRALRRT
jgi:hypothetical protein